MLGTKAIEMDSVLLHSKRASSSERKKKLSDFDLVTRFQSGDKSVFEELVKRHENKVISLAMSYTRNEQDAKDIYQEAFIRVYRSLDNFEMKSQFSTWLYRIVVNLCLTFVSSNKAVPFSSFAKDDDMDDIGVVDMLTQVPDNTTAYDASSLIEASFNVLNEKQRLYFVMKHIEGYKLEEIAEINGTTIGSVKKTLFVALAKMRSDNPCSQEIGRKEIGLEEETLRRFFSSIAKFEKPVVSSDLSEQWRESLLSEIEIIEKTRNRQEAVKRRNKIYNYVKDLLFSKKTSFAFVFLLAVSGFIVGILSYRHLFTSKSISEDLFLPGLEVEQVKFIKKPSDTMSDVAILIKASVPIQVEGTINDEYIKNALSKTLSSSCNPYTKLECLDIIENCDALKNESEIKAGLLYALQNDYNPSVRLKAMQILVKDNFGVDTQKTLSDFICSGEGSAIRSAAVYQLVNKVKSHKSIKLDETVLANLSEHVETEPDRFIRNQIQQILYKK
ncbi:hypothetical protein CHS0354_024030 [Potamilus streckersoni]|uniref:Uncharacterized protein n=1 Tax=Potamilus streckersoni TaxID=2493646 RepID=A0AAE0RZL3_9BIVA|nr:hypothetical protein CHS0354_024030 [Potamilus streckersoni]